MGMVDSLEDIRALQEQEAEKKRHQQSAFLLSIFQGGQLLSSHDIDGEKDIFLKPGLNGYLEIGYLGDNGKLLVVYKGYCLAYRIAYKI